MGAFAAVSLPLDLLNGAGASAAAGEVLVAKEVAAAYPGTRGVDFDVAGSALLFELHFPGNLSGLVRRLRDQRIAVGARARIFVPVRALVPELIASSAAVDERLVHGPEVWDAQFTRGAYVSEARLEGGHVEASIVPSSEAMHQVYDAMLALGLVAADASATVPAGVR